MTEQIVRHLAALYPEAQRVGAQQLSFAVGSSKVHVQVRPADDQPAFARTPLVSLGYRLEGPLDGAEDLVRALLRQLAREVAAFAPPPQPIDARLVDEIAEAYRTAVIAGNRPQRTGPTPCLSLEMRPLPPHGSLEALSPLVEPCTGCGVAASCAASVTPSVTPRPLRPLRHAEPLAAALAATRAIAAAWDRSPPAAIDELLLELVCDRVGARSVPAPPFELSLKIEQGRLLPAIRVVEYSATGPLRAERGRQRRRALAELATRLAPGVPYGEWLDLVEAHQPAGLEVSIGIEARLDGGGVSAQLYTHIDPTDRAAMLRLAEGVVHEATNGSWSIASLLGLELERPLALVLLAFSPGPDDVRRTKLYISAPLALSHPPSGLGPAALADVSAYAPAWGLAVLECGATGARWRKHDFPCTAHFQKATGLARDFGRGLDEADARRLDRILCGDAFAPWPTWVSVSPTERTLYFIPR